MEPISTALHHLLIDMLLVTERVVSHRTVWQFVHLDSAFYILSLALMDRQLMRQCLCIHG